MEDTSDGASTGASTDNDGGGVDIDRLTMERRRRVSPGRDGQVSPPTLFPIDAGGGTLCQRSVVICALGVVLRAARCALSAGTYSP